jgi:hypothetical protein
MNPTGRGCDHQSPLMFSFLQQKLKRAIGPFGSLAHVPGTVFPQLSRKSKVLMFLKNS